MVLLFQSFTSALSTEMASGSGESAANDGHRGGRRFDLRPRDLRLRDGDLDRSAANTIHPATSSKANAGPSSQMRLSRRRSPRGSPISSSAPLWSRGHIASSRGHDKVRSPASPQAMDQFCCKQHKGLLFNGEHCLGCRGGGYCDADSSLKKLENYLPGTRCI